MGINIVFPVFRISGVLLYDDFSVLKKLKTTNLKFRLMDLFFIYFYYYLSYPNLIKFNEDTPICLIFLIQQAHE